MTLISSLTIGIPSFLLALEPNYERVKGDFFHNIISKALPGGLTIVMNLLIILFTATHLGFTQEEISTLCLILTGFTGFIVLKRIASPLNKKRTILLITLIILFIAALLLFPQFFAVVPLNQAAIIVGLAIMPIDYFFFNRLFQWMSKK